MSVQFAEMLKTLSKIVDANVEEGNTVHILTDTSHDPLVWQAVAAAVRGRGAEPIISIFPPRPADYYDPPRAVGEAMKNVDLNILLTTTSMLHSQLSYEAMQAGVPVLSMDGGMTPEMLMKGAATANYELVGWIEYAIYELVFKGASTVRLTSEKGCDLTCSLEGRVYPIPPPHKRGNVLRVRRFGERGKRALFGTVFPAGEFNTPPVEGSGEGRLVIDTTMHGVGLLREPIIIDIVKGRIQDIRGGSQADEFRRILEQYGDENSWLMPTEFSIGANPSARVVGVQREDKNILGSVHVGLGTNEDMGGAVRSALHMDAIILKPTVEVNGEVKVKDGVILGLRDYLLGQELLSAESRAEVEAWTKG